MSSKISTVGQQGYGWLGAVLISGFGIAMLLMSYGIYKDDLWQDENSTRAPVVCMKILHRTRGAGTVKLPDNIYAEYQGKTYHFEMGRKYYRSLSGVDSIQACLDPHSGRAFLPISRRVKHFTALYFLIGGAGLAIVIGSMREFVKLARAGRRKSRAL